MKKKCGSVTGGIDLAPQKKKKIGTLPNCRLIHKTADGTTGVEWRTKKTAQVQRRFLLTGHAT